MREPPAASNDAASIDAGCAQAAGNSLHLTSASSSGVIDHDAAIDSILTQPSSDERLAQINRRMYQSLRALDAELRREQRLAACEQQPFSNPVLQARASNQSGVDAGVVGSAATGSAVAAARSLRRTSSSPSAAGGSGGNGAIAPKIVPGSDNDVVARRLRKAAEQETNPSLRAKLWKEYTDYRQGASQGSSAR